MAIYSDQYRSLKALLEMAGNQEDSTLLIPDLQRPYVWTPQQVIVLVDSLIRGWPFGTLLTWKVKHDDPARELARAFWKVEDRTGSPESERISAKHPPADFHMVLDGQQRVQSLLLAMGGDGWGFRLLDREWHEVLNGTKARGPRGKSHWSLGCLCVDLRALAAAYAIAKRATRIDYSGVLKWVVTDGATGQSKETKPSSYVEPLESAVAEENAGRFVRLARVWQAAPDQPGTDSYAAEELASAMLAANTAGHNQADDFKRPLGALIAALADVKQTRVTYLELAEYSEAQGARDGYSDAVVNIFTRLNTAGRVLTKEDITFAWLKIGWNSAATSGKGARECIESLAGQLDDAELVVSTEDIVSAVNLVWAAAYNGGTLLNNNDLMKGDSIRPMALQISEDWPLVIEAMTQVSQVAAERELKYRTHYQSLNAMAYLYAWYFGALRWRKRRHLNEREGDSFDKMLASALGESIDQWLICSQWAGIWSGGSSDRLGGYVTRLADCQRMLVTTESAEQAISVLSRQLSAEVHDLERLAIDGLGTMHADDRSEVRAYQSALWIWNRLDAERWSQAQIALRQRNRRRPSFEVDHIVAWDLWRTKVEAARSSEVVALVGAVEPLDEVLGLVNQIGNCMLLDKNFNISKGKKPLSEFLAGVHEFKSGTVAISAWASAMAMDMRQVDSSATLPPTLEELFAARTTIITDDLRDFVRGKKRRVDVD